MDVLQMLLEIPNFNKELKEGLVFLKGHLNEFQLNTLSRELEKCLDEDGVDLTQIRCLIRKFCERDDFLDVRYISGRNGRDGHFRERDARDAAREESGTLQNLYTSVTGMIRTHDRDRLYQIHNGRIHSIGMGYGEPYLEGDPLSVFAEETVNAVIPPPDRPLMSELCNQKSGDYVYSPFKKLIDYVHISAGRKEDALLLAIRNFCYKLSEWYPLIKPAQQESLQDWQDDEDSEKLDRRLFSCSMPSAEDEYAVKELLEKLLNRLKAVPEHVRFLQIYRECGMNGTATARRLGRSNGSISMTLDEIRLRMTIFLATEWQYCCSDEEIKYLLQEKLIPSL